MKRHFLLLILLFCWGFLFSGCTLGESGGISYEDQLYSTSLSFFETAQQQELKDMAVILQAACTLEGNAEDKGYLRGYLESMYHRFPAIYCLASAAPRETMYLILGEEMATSYAEATDAQTEFLYTLLMSLDMPELLDPASELRVALSDAKTTFEKLYAINLIRTESQTEAYIENLSVYATKIKNVSTLLQCNNN